MEKIKKLLHSNRRYQSFQRRLEAARICQTACELSSRQFEVVSFKNGLLTLAVDSSAQAANLQSEKNKIIEKINQKIGERVVERIRFKIT